MHTYYRAMTNYQPKAYNELTEHVFKTQEGKSVERPEKAVRPLQEMTKNIYHIT